MAAQQGGHEAEFVEEVPDRYICNICTKPLNNPQLTVCCGQHYCHSCLKQWLEAEWKTQSCPHCRAKGYMFQHVVNKSLQREILSLKVKCYYQEEGCQWNGELGSQNDHLVAKNGCRYVEVECPKGCVQILDFQLQQYEKIKIKRKDLDKHLKEDCHNRQYQCEHCGERARYIEITGKGFNYAKVRYHYQVCKEMLIDCPNRCNAGKIKRRNIANHRTECPLESVQCPNKCVSQIQIILDEDNTTKMLRKDLEYHLKNECYLRPYKCKHCNLESTYEAITGHGVWKQPTNHYDTCREFPLPCPNNCGVNDIRRKKLKAHRLECPEETVQCPNKCTQSFGGMKRKDVHKHVTEVCQQCTCEHCGIINTYTAITKHYASCPNYPLECPNKCGGKSIMRKNMTLHRDKCPLQPVDCPFAEAGCKTKVVRQDLEKHATTTQQQHLFMMMETLTLMKQDHQKELQQTKRELDGVKTQLNRTREENQRTKDELTETKKELNKTSKELREMKEKAEQDRKKPVATRQSEYDRRKPPVTRSSSASLKAKPSTTERRYSRLRGHSVNHTQCRPGQRQDDHAYELDYSRFPMDGFGYKPRHDHEGDQYEV